MLKIFLTFKLHVQRFLMKNNENLKNIQLWLQLELIQFFIRWLISDNFIKKLRQRNITIKVSPEYLMYVISQRTNLVLKNRWMQDGFHRQKNSTLLILLSFLCVGMFKRVTFLFPLSPSFDLWLMTSAFNVKANALCILFRNALLQGEKERECMY